MLEIREAFCVSSSAGSVHILYIVTKNWAGLKIIHIGKFAKVRLDVELYKYLIEVAADGRG